MKRTVDDLALEAFSIAIQTSTDTILARLLTHQEKVALGRRLLIAEAIKSGRTRMEINERIRVSPNTFAQINRWLASEEKTYLPATPAKQISRKHVSRRQSIERFSYEDMKRRYPMHFLLFSLVEELWKQN